MPSYKRVKEEYFPMETTDTALITDDQEEQNPKPKVASWISSSFIMSNSILDTGFLNMPQTYLLVGGIYTAMLTHVVCAILILIGMVIVAHCSKKTGKKTLQDLVFHYCGHSGLVVANFCIIAELGSCITYLICIGDQVDQVMRAVFGDYFCNYWYLDRTFTLPVISILLIFPTCLIKNIQNLNYISYLGTLSVIYLIFFVFWEYFHENLSPETRFSMKEGHWVDSLNVAPTLMFSYQVNIEAVPLLQSMKNPSVNDFTKGIVLCMIITTSVYIIIGTLGLLTFGSAVASDILTNYDSSDGFVICAMVMLVLKIIATYPVVLYGIRLVFDDILVCVSKDKWSEPKRTYILSSVLFFITLIIAVLVPSIGGVINSVGIVEVILCLIFPGLAFFEENNTWNSWYDLLRCLGGALLIAIGALVFGVTFVQVVQHAYIGEFSHRDVACLQLDL